ncbi:NUDIX hydrolase [Kribbella capetownensis]|uniref:NUDIX hydrolase n=1 Tax=Kribbella capetownensis TaxID=1572659 RepID=A0A4R0JEX0_9ACTN|nr:NUDIX hydrolase [Kribbella capetownensis]TCC44667.1 NUDIX hydrolase [Kribbella capetownensis]
MPQHEAIVAVLRQADQVLVIRRGPGACMPGYWAPLSGTLEPGESQQEALVREVQEEIGLAVTPLAKVWESATARGDYLLHWWTAAASPGEVTADPREVSETRWVTPAQFLALEPIFAGDREFFGKIFPRL